MKYQVIVIGGGHAGIEAAAAAAHLNMRTLLITLNKKMIGNTPCNPHIGGSAKGIVVREIDALGGMMGKFADHHPLQIKMLNTAKGPGVQCLRAQVDKKEYPAFVQGVLEKIDDLTILEDEVKSLIVENGTIKGVNLGSGKAIMADAVIITTGTYMNSSIISGWDSFKGGPDGEKASIGLSENLRDLGVSIRRLKTGTPPRVDGKTIDWSKGSIQPGMGGELAFSYETKAFTPLKEQLPCYLIYTSDETIKIIKDHLSESAVFNGIITGIGPRYCPSIESKVVRFADKPRHQLFLEPEFRDGDSIYVQGFSTGFDHQIQERLIHSLPGLEKAKILKYAYQIEYDAVDPFELKKNLEFKKIKGLFGAGQICGTSGYEEAAGLGLMAGINAVRYLKKEEPFILRRDESYIGVMIDDLVTKGADEPYRLLSSRAEYRLLLRHDNADERLTAYGHDIGLISDERYEIYLSNQKKIAEAIEIMSKTNLSDKEYLRPFLEASGYSDFNVGHRCIDLLKRPGLHYSEIKAATPELKDYEFNENSILSLETKVKYEGYIKKALSDAERTRKMEFAKLPADIDYQKLDGLRLEARQKLNMVKPTTIGQAGRIAGVNPADISALILILKKEGRL